MNERILQLEAQVRELLEWKARKEQQQLIYPLDENSRNAIEIDDFIDRGPGSATLTQSINLSGNAQTIVVPAAFTASRKVLIGGAEYEIPYI